jgi:hypothetical protein
MEHASTALASNGSIFIELSKQGISCTKASGSPGAKFSRNFLILWGHLMQWIPLLPKEGGLIKVDIDGHPPFPTGSKHFSGNFGNLLFLAIFNFLGQFEGLNNVFSQLGTSIIQKGSD